jgi:hypothetical protein
MKILHILCDGGLGNRLNALIGGMLVAEEQGLDVRVSWPLNNWCRADFNELFDYRFNSYDNQDIYQVFEANKNNYFAIHNNQINYPIPQGKHIHANNYQLPHSAAYYHGTVPPRFTPQQIMDKLKLFPIETNIHKKVHDFCDEQSITHEVVGVHLRRTDFKTNQSESEIISWIKEHSDVRFFVCSDDKETELLYSQLYNVIIHPKQFYVDKFVEGDWNTQHKDEQGRVATCNMNRSKNAVLEGFVDMLILAYTNIQVGQERSTYFKYAKMYNQIIKTK